MGCVVEPEGLLFVGRFARREIVERGDRKFPQLVVSVTFYDGSVRERGLTVDSVDYQTGEVTRIWDALEGLEAGTPIAVRVRVRPTNDGKSVWMKALSFEVCEPVYLAERAAS